MLYNDQIATLYRVENGFVVECRVPKAAKKLDASKGDCCSPCGPEYETKTYTAAKPADVMRILGDQMGGTDKEYADAFNEATATKKPKAK